MKYIKTFIAVILLVCLDQITKLWAVNTLRGTDGIPIIKNVFHLYYLENFGGAFGIFQNKQPFFIVTTLITVVLIFIVYTNVPADKKYLPIRACMVFIMAGAFGNLIDRVRYNYVIDFLYFKLIDFPVFNVADCYVTVSLFLLAFMIFFVYKDDELSFLSFSKKQERK